VLQCVVVCCSVLHCVAEYVAARVVSAVGNFVAQVCRVYCRVLQCVAVCCSVLQCVSACCSVVVQCVAARVMSVWQCAAV